MPRSRDFVETGQPCHCFSSTQTCLSWLQDLSMDSSQACMSSTLVVGVKFLMYFVQNFLRDVMEVAV